jgi:hypothetical protein
LNFVLIKSFKKLQGQPLNSIPERMFFGFREILTKNIRGSDSFTFPNKQ